MNKLMARGINHVSVNAGDLSESVAFYVELLGAEPIPSPNFGVPVQWLTLGRTQLHLFQRDVHPRSHHHFAVTVEVLKGIWEINPQDDDNRRGRLFVPDSPARTRRCAKDPTTSQPSEAVFLRHRQQVRTMGDQHIA